MLFVDPSMHEETLVRHPWWPNHEMLGPINLSVRLCHYGAMEGHWCSLDAWGMEEGLVCAKVIWKKVGA